MYTNLIYMRRKTNLRHTKNLTYYKNYTYFEWQLVKAQNWLIKGVGACVFYIFLWS